jgi:hypothetical protein
MLIGLRAMLPPTNMGFDRPLTDQDKDTFINNLQLALSWCEEIRLHSVASYIRTCLDTPRDKIKIKSVVKMLEGIEERLDENLKAVNFKFVPFESAELYLFPSQFGPIVADKFPSADYDIEEAAKCYALDRHTACVMHLMRVLEVSLEAVGRGVGLPNAVELAKNNWTTALKAIGDQIGANDKAADPTWTPEKSSFFKDVRAQLFAVKVAWRDNAMHLEKKYDLKDTKRIYDAAKNFMEHLAEHLDQAGNFTP